MTLEDPMCAAEIRRADDHQKGIHQQVLQQFRQLRAGHGSQNRIVSVNTLRRSRSSITKRHSILMEQPLCVVLWVLQLQQAP